MAAPRSRRSTTRGATARTPDSSASATRSEPAGIVPELLRRAVGLGFSGFFTTEELLRKALGDTVPRDWAEFVAAQTERARRELIDRLAHELRRSLDTLDLQELLGRVLESHVVEIDARIRFAPKKGGDEPASIRVRVEHGDTK